MRAQMRSFVFLVPPSSVERLMAAGEMKLELAFTPAETEAWTDTPDVSLSHARWRLGHVMQARSPQTWASANLSEASGQLDKRHRQVGGFDPVNGQRAVRRLGRDWSGHVGFIDRVAPEPASTSEVQPKQYFLHFSVSADCGTAAAK